jgi:hypothetical protein
MLKERCMADYAFRQAEPADWRGLAGGPALAVSISSASWIAIALTNKER